MPTKVQAHNDGEVSDMVDKVDQHPRPPNEPPAPADASPAGTDGQQHQTHVRQAPEAVQHDEREGVNPEISSEGVATLPGADGEENSGLASEPPFPVAELAKLDEMVGRPRWIVPVLPRGELEVLLRAALNLCTKGLDTRSEPCQRFFREGLTTSFTKVLTDEAVSGWKMEIQLYVLDNCKLLIDICACKLLHDWFPLLDLLAIAFNPYVKFHMFNAARGQTSTEDAMNTDGYARAGDVRSPKHWLVELINRFGQQRGFEYLVERFRRAQRAAAGDTSSGSGPLNLPLACALIKPFGLCYEYLTESTMTNYMEPVLDILRQFLEGLTDEELKKESTRATSEAKNDLLAAIFKSVLFLIPRLPHHEERMRDAEMFRLKMILRLLKISSFNGKMNALNEVNKVITNATYSYQRHNSGMGGSLAEEETRLTAENVAAWIKENDVLDVVLRDNLHQPQYVEKLEKIVRFMLKERALEDRDLLRIWEAQQGKHEAIVKNVHELLAKLAWDFTADQLEYLFKCVQDSWHHANKKQRERLLELIRRLAEDDKDGIMAQKVLGLLWSLACSSDCPTDIMDQALTSFIKILDFSCSQDRELLKVDWIHRLVDELKKNERYVLPSLKQIREICQLFPEAPPNHSQMPRPVVGHVTYRKSIIYDLQEKDKIMDLVTSNLTTYMEKIVQMHSDYPNKLPSDFVVDNHYGHSEQVSERLRFLRFLLKDGHMRLNYVHAEQIWHCLTNQAVFDSDREACFKWFTKLMGDEPYLLHSDIFNFFTKLVLRLDPAHLTEFGMTCFDRFFRFVNTLQKKLKQKRKGGFVVDDLDLVGIEYIWRVVLHGSNVIAEKGICVLKDIYTNLGPRLLPNQMAIHKNFVDECYDRLRASHDNLKALAAPTDSGLSVNGSGGAAGDCSTGALASSMASEETRMVRVLTVLREYVSECDDAYAEERLLLPLHRASQGKHMLVIARLSIPGRQTEDCELTSHSNDTLGSLRRQLHQHVCDRFKGSISQFKIEIYHNNEIVDNSEDKKLVTAIGIRDKSVLSIKLCQLGSPGSGLPAGPSHSESSSEDSSPGGSPRPRSHVGPSREAEHFLPGVMLANEPGYVPFLLAVADTSGTLGLAQLRTAVRALLKLVPPHMPTINILKDMSMQCDAVVKQVQQHIQAVHLECAIFGSQLNCSPEPSPALVLYNLEIVYSLLMPAISSDDDTSSRFQLFFMDSGGAALILKMISNNDFLATADADTRRSAYLVALRIAKLVFVTVAYATVYAVGQATGAGGALSAVPPDEYERAVQLQQALRNIPPLESECTVRTVAMVIAQRLVVSVRERGGSWSGTQWYAGGSGSCPLPDIGTVRALFRLGWSAAGGSLQLCCTTSRDADLAQALEQAPVTSGGCGTSLEELDDDDSGDETVQVAREAIEVLTVCLIFCPGAIDTLQGENAWQAFVVGLVLVCPSRTVRYSACEQLYLISTRCSGGEQSHPSAVTSAIAHLFTVLQSECVRRYAKQSYEFFNLLCLLMSAALSASIEVPAAEKLLSQEVAWLKRVRAEHLRHHGASDSSSVEAPEESLLEGHLNVARQLVLFMSAEKKYLYGGDQPDGKNLVKELMDDFIFASARKPVAAALPEYQKAGDAMPTDSDSPSLMQPICSTSRTIRAAYELLVALCTGCVQNLRAVSDLLTQMYYSGTELPLTEWEYMPPVGARPTGGFVGLKNGGATCYMNSVLQQLYMISPVFESIVSAEGAICEGDEELEDVDDHSNVGLGDDILRQPSDARPFPGENRSPPTLGPVHLEPSPSSSGSSSGGGNNVAATSRADSTRAYNLTVLKHVQLIFAHLAFSKLQFYVPRGFWKHFRLQGEPVNLREQHDALEFFNSLVDSLDEALKSVDQPPVLSRVLGGTYADQKICKDCPHRYSIEQPFTALNVDIRNHQHLKESLEQFVKGDLLEGANAYYCEHCGKKVDTVKRLCVKKLPKMLVIQLKRFDYDWERECAIKFNDYFEFPRDLDMEPYTVYGLARMEGEKVPDEEDSCIDQKTAYRLVGVVVHSGQASGGHYYSYIQHRPASGLPKWYKFDDGDVSECKMEDDEEMKNQCFGGDYMGEVYDHTQKRMNLRRQKRWWNAYLLFYEQIGNAMNNVTHQMNEMSLSMFKSSSLKIPRPIERVVRKQNVEFMHNRNQYSHEYFNFLRNLLNCNIGAYLQARQQGGHLELHHHQEELSMLSVQLATKFLFSVGFRTKKTLRGSAGDWCDIVNGHLSVSRTVRHWFAVNALLANPYRFTEYLLESPNTEVRNVFGRMVAYLAHVSLQDGPCSLPRLPAHVAELDAQVAHTSTVSDHVLLLALGLLRKEVLDNGRHTAQYFQLFVTYAHMGHEERRQLLRLDVLTSFMAVALDESPGQPFKCQYSEFSKICSVVSALMRCCDLSGYCETTSRQMPTVPNPHGDVPLQALPLKAAEMLYKKPTFTKKLIEENNSSDDTIKLLLFVCWENMQFSRTLISELLWQIAYSYTYELRPYLDLLLRVVIMEDSWQLWRLELAVGGIPDEREGLLDTIQISKNHYQKRGYQCIKMMVNLFGRCPPALQMLHQKVDVKKKWQDAVEWLNEELERRPHPSTQQYSYNNSWSPPATSNETSNSYFLERSNSARLTLSKAIVLCTGESKSSSGAGGTTGDEKLDDDTETKNDTSTSQDEFHSASPSPNKSSSSLSLGQQSITQSSLVVMGGGGDAGSGGLNLSVRGGGGSSSSAADVVDNLDIHGSPPFYPGSFAEPRNQQADK